MANEIDTVDVCGWCGALIVYCECSTGVLAECPNCSGNCYASPPVKQREAKPGEKNHSYEAWSGERAEDFKEEKVIIRITGEVLTTPFSCIDYLQGFVYGHPKFPDGSYVTVPNVVWDEDVGAYRSPSGKHYRLGTICGACNQLATECRCG